ncbi:MAG: toxin TcdB middle/N-terminal domain-containing protein [Pseudomonadota bacterium]
MRLTSLFLLLFLLLVLPVHAAEDKSGVKPNVLSLPSGPGSIEGLGESFEPQLNSGTSSYQVPLAVLPGRNGFMPELALTYNSGNANGPFGLGWKLTLPSIQRQTDKGLPLYTLWPTGDGFDNDNDGTTDEYDEFDTLIYDGGEELVPVSDTLWRLENETQFLRIERLESGWQITRKNGVILRFGLTSSARVEETDRVFRWHLEEMIDPNGNSIAFFYEKYAGASQPYLKSIIYNSSGSNQMEIRFHYETRADILTDYRPGFLLETAFRCSRIEMYAADSLVRAYKLSYASTSPNQPLSLLTSVAQVGRDNISELPPAQFTYTTFDGASTQVQLAANTPNVNIDDANIDLIDLNGDALPDILDTNQQPNSYYLNQGKDDDGLVQWGSYNMMQSNVGLYLSAPTTRLADMDGDGRSDLVDVNSSTVLYHKVGVPLQWGAGIPITGAGFSFQDQNIAEIDADNDKRTDVLQSAGGDLFLWLNNGAGGWSQRFITSSPNPLLQLDLNTTKLADMNGDHLLDLVYISQGTCLYYPNMGFGRFGSQIRMNNAPMTILDQDRLFVSDVNGDGRGDVIYLGNSIQVWLNLGLLTANHSQGQFADPFTINSPYLNAFLAIRQTDINGNGSNDILWNTNLMGGIDIAYVDFTTTEKPYQLKTITNGTGQKTTISYSSSVQEMVRDQAAGKPWPESVPIAVPVVGTIEVDDGLGHSYSRTFLYHDGYYDGEEKEFRGFARAEQIEEGDNSIAGMITEYQFDTGVNHDSLKGKILALETRNTDNEVFYREVQTWQTRVLTNSVEGDLRSVSFPYLSDKVREVIEKSDLPISQKWEYQYDDYGNTVRILDYGRLDEGWDDERLTVSTYTAANATGLAAWILDKPVEQITSDENGAVVSRQRNYYDSLALGQVSKGNLTKKEDWIKGENWQTTSRNDYDAYGNITAIYDGLYGSAPGHYRFISYDPLFHTFPVQETIYTGNQTVPSLSMSATYDAGWGQMTSSSDYNGHTTSYGYDTFGRITDITKPGDSQPTEAYDYVLAHALNEDRVINWVETRKRESTAGGTVDSRTFYDGLGRKVMTRSEGEVAGQVVVSDTVVFNDRKLPWKKYLPYFEEGSSLDYHDPTWNTGFTEHIYDGLGREIRINQPVGPEGLAYSTTDYEPFSKTVKDEEQTDPTSLHFGNGMRYVEDGLQDKDGKGRLREVHESVKLADNGMPLGSPVEWQTSYSYNLLDNLTGYTDAQNNQKIIEYDGLGRKTFMNDPDRGQMTYEYDAAGNLIKTLDAKNQVLRYNYDGINRLTAEFYGAEAQVPEVEYHYDAPSGPLDMGAWWQGPTAHAIAQSVIHTEPVDGFDLNQDGVIDISDVVKSARQQQSPQTVTAAGTKGYLSWIKDQSGEEHNSYDSRGRIEWLVKRIKSGSSNELENFYTGMAYDSMDRVTDLTYPDQTTVSYQFNNRGLLEAVPGVINAYDYNPAGQNKFLTLATGVSTTYDYDHRLRLTALQTLRSSDSLRLQGLAYTYDKVSNITAIIDNRTNSDLETIGGELALATDIARKFNASQTFSYDSLYRLTSAENATIYGALTYRYDRIGNMVAKDATLLTPNPLMNLGAMSSGGTAGTWNRFGRNPGDQPGPHAVTATAGGTDGPMAFSYDDNGNMTLNRGMTLSWDFKDRLTHMTKNTVSGSYLYDYTNTRKRKICEDSANGKSDESLYVDKFSEVRNSHLQKYIYAGNNRVAKAGDAAFGQPIPFKVETYFLHDHLGSTNLSLNNDGSVVEQLSNFPFGLQRLTSQTDVERRVADYRFTGKESDMETDLQYFEARYYEPVLGNFISIDPKNSDVSQKNDWLEQSKKINNYSYVINNPVTMVDPDGKEEIRVKSSMMTKGLVLVHSGYYIVKLQATHQVHQVKSWINKQAKSILGKVKGLIDRANLLKDIGTSGNENVEKYDKLVKQFPEEDYEGSEKVANDILDTAEKKADETLSSTFGVSHEDVKEFSYHMSLYEAAMSGSINTDSPMYKLGQQYHLEQKNK